MSTGLEAGRRGGAAHSVRTPGGDPHAPARRHGREPDLGRLRGYDDPPRHRARRRLTGRPEPPFPHRVDLVASAFEHLAEQRIARYSERAAELPDDRATRRVALLDLLWEDFSSSLFTVAVKLWVAAAEDNELRQRLVPVEKRIYASVSELAREVAGELGEDDPHLDRKLAVAMNTVAGLALVREFDPSGRAIKGNQWPYHRAALEPLFGG